VRLVRHINNSIISQKPGNDTAMTEFRYPDDCQSNDDIADYWAVRLDDVQLTAAEEIAFERWQAADPQNPARLIRARQTWHSMEIAAAELSDMDNPAKGAPSPKQDHLGFDSEAVRRDLERLGALEGGNGRLPGMRSAKRRARPMLAIFTILLLVGLWGYSAFQPDADLIAASNPGVVSEVHELSDGSRIWMEPGTRVAMAYSDQYRDLTVQEGGVFIEVAKDSTRPLRIHLNKLTATAVGTAFSASKWGGHVRVEVSEGTVDLESRTAKLARLTAGRASWQDADGDMHYGTVALDRVAAWRTGRWVVNDMPIDELFARLSPLLDDTSFVRDPRMGEITVSGSFDLTKPDGAYGAILAAYGLTDRAVPGGFKIISKK
tara:strand:- start:15 stop:1145 length:1131 start_codon:yes stop_codon:yes gene_type:complete